jgi:thiol:disulfide interchange protein DsbC
MIKPLLRACAVALALLAVTGPGTTHADEASVKKAFLAKFPKAQVDSVIKLKELDLYQIVVPRGDEPMVIYTDEAFRFMMQGSVIETKGMQDLTEVTMRKLTAIDFATLPLDQAIRKVKGKGERKLAVFSDPDCPFCKRVEQTLEKVDNVTIYIFPFPIDQLHPNAAKRAKEIWCAPDRLKAWDDYMLRGVSPAPLKTECDNPIAKLQELGKSKGINATPTLVFADGSRVPGALGADQIEQNLSSVTTGK